jgi:hypothetical protein
MDMMLQIDEGVMFSEIGLTVCEILGFHSCVVEFIALPGF